MNKINADTAKIRDMAKELKDLTIKAKEEEREQKEMEEKITEVKGDESLVDEDDPSKSSRTRYEEALYCLTDPLLPVRGHGLIELTRLIKEKDEQTIKHANKVLNIFRVSKDI